MQTVNCVILDDESMNVQLLSKMLNQHCPQVHIQATETDAKKGIALVTGLQPQLLFLDVEMPDVRRNFGRGINPKFGAFLSKITL